MKNLADAPVHLQRMFWEKLHIVVILSIVCKLQTPCRFLDRIIVITSLVLTFWMSRYVLSIYPVFIKVQNLKIRPMRLLIVFLCMIKPIPLLVLQKWRDFHLIRWIRRIEQNQAVMDDIQLQHHTRTEKILVNGLRGWQSQVSDLDSILGQVSEFFVKFITGRNEVGPR